MRARHHFNLTPSALVVRTRPGVPNAHGNKPFSQEFPLCSGSGKRQACVAGWVVRTNRHPSLGSKHTDGPPKAEQFKISVPLAPVRGREVRGEGAVQAVEFGRTRSKKLSSKASQSAEPYCEIPPHPQPLSRAGERGADSCNEVLLFQSPFPISAASPHSTR